MKKSVLPLIMLFVLVANILVLPIDAKDTIEWEQEGFTYIGSVEIPSDDVALKKSIATTDLYVKIVPYAGGKPTRCSVIVGWSGNAGVNYVSASELLVKNSSLLDGTVYYDEALYFNGGLELVGTYTAGYCTIPQDVEKVNIKLINCIVDLHGVTGELSIPYPWASYDIPW